MATQNHPHSFNGIGNTLPITDAFVSADMEQTWPPRAQFLKCLVAAVPGLLASQNPETGRFGVEPWIVHDQHAIFPLTAAWSIKDKKNPWHCDPKVLEAVCKGGGALVDDQDAMGMWTFRKKDHSTWGQIHMPWTYSRWIQAYYLTRDAMPTSDREKWERGLLLGFTGIRKYMDMDGDIHNIPSHQAMALYIAGICFGNEEWKEAAKRYQARVVAKQTPSGFWSEHFGPVVGYNGAYIESLGIYYHFSKDPVVLNALRRAALFNASILWPDRSFVSCIDERNIYEHGTKVGNPGFSWTPEGRGYLLHQTRNLVNLDGGFGAADYAAGMLLWGGEGIGTPFTAQGEHGNTIIGDGDALIRRDKPWQYAFSGYACKPFWNRWIQDRQNLVDIYHDKLGLVIGGGNTKLQPYWSTFTVGDPTQLSHTDGDETPNFVPDIDLLWTPDKASIRTADGAMDLRYGDIGCSVAVHPRAHNLLLTYRAPDTHGKRVEAHVPILWRNGDLKLASGTSVPMGEEPVSLTSEQTGAHITWAGLRVTIPDRAKILWPVWQHDPYRKDGRSSLHDAKLVIALPFGANVTEQVLTVSAQY
ncbi:MAG: hypothetical protein KJ964_07730 [Verrucomicrobia bacterium]|nr:hypothetical protein [Verrucomicrobiota bacterium]MBU1735152.1 hypothetical protein [Verrucomicrobiota bacterium]MBU1856443.1 hypothetical protein [Verrucomicrobiota bacterium]